jgi:hypothetical protein
MRHYDVDPRHALVADTHDGPTGETDSRNTDAVRSFDLSRFKDEDCNGSGPRVVVRLLFMPGR